MQAAADMLAAKGVKTVAVIYMDDVFGLENMAAFEPAVKAKGIEIVDKKSYPLGIKDLSPVLRGIKDKNPDAFVGLTYPPDTILASKQSKEIGFNPKVFFTAVGTAFPLYKQVMGADSDGVTGIGSWSTKTSPAAKAYFEAHVKKFSKEPDRWASAHCWAGLQILQAGIEKVGSSQGHPRLHRGGQPRDHPRPAPLQGLRDPVPRHRQPMVRRRLRSRWPLTAPPPNWTIPKPAWK